MFQVRFLNLVLRVNTMQHELKECLHRMLNIEFSNKYPYVVPEQAPLIILYNKEAIYMDNNGKETKHTRHITRRMHFVRNDEECNFHKTVWCEGGLQLEEIGTKNIKEDELNLRLGYEKVRIYNGKNSSQRGVTGYRRV